MLEDHIQSQSSTQRALLFCFSFTLTPIHSGIHVFTYTQTNTNRIVVSGWGISNGTCIDRRWMSFIYHTELNLYETGYRMSKWSTSVAFGCWRYCELRTVYFSFCALFVLSSHSCWDDGDDDSGDFQFVINLFLSNFNLECTCARQYDYVVLWIQFEIEIMMLPWHHTFSGLVNSRRAVDVPYDTMWHYMTWCDYVWAHVFGIYSEM